MVDERTKQIMQRARHLVSPEVRDAHRRAHAEWLEWHDVDQLETDDLLRRCEQRRMVQRGSRGALHYRVQRDALVEPDEDESVLDNEYFTRDQSRLLIDLIVELRAERRKELDDAILALRRELKGNSDAT